MNNLDDLQNDLQQGNGKPYELNYYGEFPSAHIDAKYEKGIFIDLADSNPVVLKEGSVVRIVAFKKDIPENKQPRFGRVKKIVLAEGTRLTFKLQGKELYFDCVLLNDLVFEKDGNKLSIAVNGQCMVEPSNGNKTKEFTPFFAGSLNQAYFQTSLRFKPEAFSHSINIYENFYVVGGKVLAAYRF